jgi:dihydrofolate reductase
MIAAVAENGVIGAGNALPWRLPGDLAHFKRLTLGNTVVMGRRTHESIGRPLPGRRTIVVTRRPVEGMETAATLAEAIARAHTPVFLAGGAGVYREGMGLADTLHITRVHARPQGDVHFPPVDTAVFALSHVAPGQRTAGDEHDVTHETYVRIATRA